MGTRLHNYNEVRKYLEKEHPDWIRALTPRHINVLAISSANAPMLLAGSATHRWQRWYRGTEERSRLASYTLVCY